MPDLKLGHRVSHAIDGRCGFVIGNVEATGWNRALVPVAIEGSTRHEYWPLCHVDLRPMREQVAALGGKYQPPKGFPLIT